MIPNTLTNIFVDMLYRIEELERRTEQRERTGTISEVDTEKKLARVQLGESNAGQPFLSPWLPWETPAIGDTKINVPPSVGQQVKVSSESGDLTEAVIRASLESDAQPLPDAEPGEAVIENTKAIRFKTPHFKLESGKVEFVKGAAAGSKPGAAIT